MGHGNSIFECMSDRDNRHNDLKSLRAKKAAKPTVHLINGVPHLSSPWPVSTDSSLHFSPSPTNFEEEDKYVVSPFDIMSPSLSRENDISVVRSKELAVLVQAGDIDSLSFMVSKWHLKYNNIRVENTPLLHLAVISDQFHMVKYLLAQGIDVEALDQEGKSAFDYAAECKNLSIYPYLKTSIASYQATQKNLPDGNTDVKEDPSAEDGNMSDSSASSSSSANSSYQTSYLSSMEVMKLRTKKEKKKLLKQKFRESNGEPVSHHDGEESVDDDNSPRKEKRIIYASTLLSEQVLSPISQSSAESTYSAVIDTESCADVELKSDIIPDEEVNIDICLKEEALDEKIEIVIVSTKEVVDEAYEPQVIFSEILSPKVSTRENSSSSFETTRTALKSPFKGMKKVAGRAFTFVSGGKYKKDKGKMLPKKKL